MKEKSIELAKAWANNTYFDENDRLEISTLLENLTENETEITERFHKDLEFGTGGLRSILGMGSNRMNKYNVRKATQAMANVVKESFSGNLAAAVSYDCRQFSDEFAKEVCMVFAANGIKAYIFTELTPTPMLSYAVRYYNCKAGVMVTASHNPKQYNGFKAYWDDGAQVTPPEDSMVIDAYNKISNWEDVKSTDFDQAVKDGMIEWIGEEVNESFYQEVEKAMVQPELARDKGDQASFIYTPLHGTGYIPCKTASERLGYKNFHIVEEQAVFDSSFSTVETTPNPEDPKALKFAVDRMLKENIDVAYGTDPDGDRLGVVVNHKSAPVYLNGNQLAFLMLYYLFEQHKLRETLPKKPLVLKSIVTSDLQTTIAEHFGGEVKDTLTGFKWMAAAWRELEKQGTDYSFFFASEESFGYMPRNHVRDKDAVTAMLLMNEITLHYKLKGMTLVDALDEIYDKLGYAQESLIALNYEGLEGQAKIARIMDHFRNEHGMHVGTEKIKVFKDYKISKAINLLTQEESSIDMTQSNVLGFEFESGNQLYIRPSGTEPKIKFYTMVKVQEGDLETKKDLAQKQIDLIENFIMGTVETI
ncbi:MAG: phospho-sugar mutase [Bacteriovoracaceae bacterium]|nr:phospho-sugar mutase [Bacteriovoracaceae bacterium]